MRNEVVGDLTELELIARVRRQLPPRPDWMLVGVGDDAAVVEPERNRVEVLTVDALVEGVHFDRAFVPPEAIGHRALAVNLSDIAAMGAAPRLALLSMALPVALPLGDFDGIISGFIALAARHRLHLAGGNLTRTPGPLMLDVTVLGTVKRRQALRRDGASPGDVLYVSGAIGAAGAGLQMLKERYRLSTTADTKDTEDQSRQRMVSSSVSSVSSEVESPAVAGSGVEGCIERYLRPDPRVRLGTLLARNRAATACMDLSDGLADAIRQVAHASGVGAIVHRSALPVDQAARDWFAGRGLDPALEALGAGDDYELLVAAHPRASRRVSAAAGIAGVPLTRVGVCTSDAAIVLRSGEGEAVNDAALPPGYGHFR